jgi:hypothetical protein
MLHDRIPFFQHSKGHCESTRRDSPQELVRDENKTADRLLFSSKRLDENERTNKQINKQAIVLTYLSLSHRKHGTGHGEHRDNVLATQFHVGTFLLVGSFAGTLLYL